MTAIATDMAAEAIITEYRSPVGALMLASVAGRLCMCDYAAASHHAGICRRVERALGMYFHHGESTATRQAAEQLTEYFAGHRRHFEIEYMAIGTPFQQRVWHALQAIPYSVTESYAHLAHRVGNPAAIRAVAAAVGANPLSIIVPCHRIIGSDGSLTGYAGGLPAKQALLALEGSILPLEAT